MRAIILAGGMGTRLKPYTVTLPKPLMPLGGNMAIIEIIIRQLAASGFDHITIAVNHMAKLVMAFCEDGSRWGIKIDYSVEEQPLSTIGPLTLIDDLPEHFLVMNGDVLSDLDYGAFLKNHILENNDASISVYTREVKIDFGVLHLGPAGNLEGFTEKPIEEFTVSMGIYGISRRIVENLKHNQPYGFDNLMIDGIKNGQRFSAVKFDGYWLDIGRPGDYDQANADFEELHAKWDLGS
jgi:NDP-sugar pyrophosphorylase family protein